MVVRKYWYSEIFQMLTCSIIQCQNFAFVNITINLTRKKMYKNGKLSSSWWWQQVFQNSNFHLFAQILSLAATILIIFLKVTVLLHSFSRKCLSNTVSNYLPGPNSHSLSLIFSGKNGIPRKKWLVS